MKRFASWGHWSITFWNGEDHRGEAIAMVTFACGPQGPIDGYIGSDLHRSYQAMCKNWVERGELPEGAYVPLGMEWLFDHDNPAPDAIWLEPRGWTSPTRVGRRWDFPELCISCGLRPAATTRTQCRVCAALEAALFPRSSS